VVLGANWCHDSVKLLERFNQRAMAQALAQRFNMAFVDVAYLEFGRATTTRYQLPLYYGTPTVLIIEPETRQLLNKTDLMHWTNAASYDVAAYQQYFLHTDFVQQFEKEQQQLSGIKPQQLLQINQFEQQQAAQLMLAYQQLGPLLKAYKTSGQPASAEFKMKWDEVKAFRSNILPEVNKLQQQAIKLAPGEVLALPVAGYNQAVFSVSSR
jgi:anion-transporting  ArsA/GET3 family ATPase